MEYSDHLQLELSLRIPKGNWKNDGESEKIPKYLMKDLRKNFHDEAKIRNLLNSQWPNINPKEILIKDLRPRGSNPFLF
jgi:hypothetical protein